MIDLIHFIKERRTVLIVGLVALVVVASVAATVSEPSRTGKTSYSIAEDSAVGLGAPGYSGGAVAYDKAYGRGAVPPMIAESVMPSYYPTPEPSAGPTAAEVDQKIIKNGFLTMVVDKVADAVTRVTDLAKAKGGFVQTSSVTERGDGTYYGNVTVRVPAKDFETAMIEIKGFATVVRNETTSGQDVTEQYTDLQAQLRNAKAQEETYLEVLKQAKSVEDILKVQERLGYIRAQIESLEGRIKYLENVTSYSTITVTLEEEPAVRAPTKEFRPLATIKEAAQVLVVVFQNLIAGLIWVIIVWGGTLLPIGLLGWIGWKIWKRRMSNK